MRSPALASLMLLAACAVEAGPRRLPRLVPAAPAGDLQAARSVAPAPPARPLVFAAMEPALPVALPQDPWLHEHPRWLFLAEFGPIRFEHETEPGGLDDDADAWFSRFHFEGRGRRHGGGMQVEYTAVDDDLHDNSGATDSDTDTFDIFGFWVGQTEGGDRFRMPVRVGPFVNAISQELTTVTTNELDYVTFGVRVEVEPEVDLVRTEAFALGLYGAFHISGGWTVIDADLEEDFLTGQFRTGVRTGVRMNFGRFAMALSLMHTYELYDESDPESINGTDVVVDEATFRRTGVLFSFGARW